LLLLEENYGDLLLLYWSRVLTLPQNPAFGGAQIRELTEIFVEKSLLLRDMWAREIKKEENNGTVNVVSWMSKATLDVIGVAGFNHSFNSLTTETGKDELGNAFSALFSTGFGFSVVSALRSMVPPLRPILKYLVRLSSHRAVQLFNYFPLQRVKGDAEAGAASKTMARVGRSLLQDSKAALRAENGKLEKSSWKTRDLLSVLLRANMATDLPPSQRMVDEDVISREYFVTYTFMMGLSFITVTEVPTFLLAGHETTRYFVFVQAIDKPC